MMVKHLKLIFLWTCKELVSQVSERCRDWLCHLCVHLSCNSSWRPSCVCRLKPKPLHLHWHDDRGQEHWTDCPISTHTHTHTPQYISLTMLLLLLTVFVQLWRCLCDLSPLPSSPRLSLLFLPPPTHPSVPDLLMGGVIMAWLSQ